VSWAAVDHSRDDGKDDEPIGFITARVVLATESEASVYFRYMITFIEASYHTVLP